MFEPSSIEGAGVEKYPGGCSSYYAAELFKQQCLKPLILSLI
ncbi:MAG: hypothetical protein ACI83D_000677 [Planctomycetota bacterium]|jgi:hypothetical protein